MHFVLSKKEAAKQRRAAFKQMKEGSLFDDGEGNYYLVAHKFSDVAMVIELNRYNVHCLLCGGQCVQKSINIKDNLVTNLLLV